MTADNGQNQRSMSVLRGAHPAIKPDKYGFPTYDSSSEDEATGRVFEQSQAMNGGAHFDEATARMTDLPLTFKVTDSGTDLLSGAPTDGDA